MSLLSNLYSKQRGLSALSMLVVILVAIFFVTAAIKLGPLYLESYTVDSSIAKAVENHEYDGMSSGKIKAKIGKTFNMNRVEGISASDIEIIKDKGVTTIDATYERRVPFLANIDVVLKFDQLRYEFKSTKSQ